MSDTITKEDEASMVEVPDNAAPVAAPARSREELQEAGWTEEEIARADKRGMLGKPAATAKAPEKPAAPPKKEEAAPAAAAEEEEEAPAPPKKDEAAPKPAKAGGLPDFTFTPEEEAGVVKLFGKRHPARAFYFRTKNERQSRQKAERELADLKGKLAGKPPAPAAEALPEGEDEAELDKPLTARMLREIKAREQEEARRQDEERRGRAQALEAAHADQEEYGRSAYEDFEPTVGLARDVMQNYEALFPDKIQQQKVLALMQELKQAAYNADRLGLDDRHAAHIAYEIGQLHPKYGQAPAPAGEEPIKDGPPKAVPKASGGFKPETLKRIETNTQRKASSASIPAGSGKRVVLAEEVTASDLLAMDYKKRAAFRKQHPVQYAKLTRG